ncbi:prenyltransferase [Maritimibacter sp. 55A14]|uniref:UbiA family prenyltransferase n=1 Tax=Maritimibacter sp. 55A14 TaxID=2174844 RepID=UPI000D60F465|nr:UbiA family prenyltransferase [Maritimibacter sp. 55A14]PWE32945.1 prenyltransferase [Maritimibacter sp. 55A14]
MESLVHLRASARNYAAIARPDHWLKNIFMLPGAALAFVIDDDLGAGSLLGLAVGIAATCLIASANYTINEFLDGKFDRHHPTKSARPTAQGKIRLSYVMLQYFALAGLGLALATTLYPMFFYAGLALLGMGLIYNVEPIRTKDKVYLDVLSESVNNPLRLILGWAAATPIILPPSSLLICYWMGGAYLMAIKRYAEYRMIADPERAGRYRRSFGVYTEESLLLSAFFYALTSVFFMGIFLIKYKIEFLISFPFFALLFAWYLKIALQPASVAMNPEKLYLNPRFLSYVVFLCGLVGVLFFVEIPAIQYLMDHSVVRDMRIP